MSRLAALFVLLPAVGAAQDSPRVARGIAAGFASVATQEQPQQPRAAPQSETGEGSQEPEPGESSESSQPDQEEPPPLESLDEARPFEWSWDSFLGLLTGRETFTAKNGRVTFRLGSAIQVDATAGNPNGLLEQTYGPIDSSVDLRRLRLSGHGRVNEMNFMVSADLGVDSGLKDFWFEGRKGGLALWDYHLGKFRFGKMREPFGFESQTSSSFTGFMERSLPSQTFSIGRNLGMMVHDVSESGRVHWSAGLFSLGSEDQDNESSSLLSITGRVTGLPFYANDGESLLHIGGSFSNRNPTGVTRYFARPEARFVDPLADTGDIDATGINLFGAEIAGVYKSLWAQAEWVHAELTAARSGNPSFDGGYAQVGWFITGESRPYRKNGGVFDRFRPELESDGWRPRELIQGGAWELVGRVSRVDLDDGRVNGGDLTDLSAALNWYATASTRLQLNYIYSMPEDQGRASIFLLRFQFQPW